jgi:excisionase family DNA binding protein
MGIFTRREAASYLRVHLNTLDKILAAPDGPRTVRYGRRVLVPRAGLDSWIRREAS